MFTRGEVKERTTECASQQCAEQLVIQTNLIAMMYKIIYDFKLILLSTFMYIAVMSKSTIHKLV